MYPYKTLENVKEMTGLGRIPAMKLVKLILLSLIEEAAEKGSANIRGLVSFKKHDVPAGRVRIPNSDQFVDIPAGMTVKIKISPALRKKLNN